MEAPGPYPGPAASTSQGASSRLVEQLESAAPRALRSRRVRSTEAVVIGISWGSGRSALGERAVVGELDRTVVAVQAGGAVAASGAELGGGHEPAGAGGAGGRGGGGLRCGSRRWARAVRRPRSGGGSSRGRGGAGAPPRGRRAARRG